MGRAPRAEYRGALYHVFSRGNRREKIFLDDDDYFAYVAALREAAGELGVAVIAYCLMPNHPHLCVQTDDAPLSVLMQKLNTRHAKRFNKKYGVRGHLHEGRYRALLVDERMYLLRLVRYIHQNPLRAGLVTDLESWTFGSHRDYLAPESWIARDRVLRHFESTQAYARFAAQRSTDEDHEVFSFANRGLRIAGDAQSAKEVAAALEREGRKPRTAWLPLGRSRVGSAEELRSQAEEWLRRSGSQLTLEELQSPLHHEPFRSARRELAGFLRSRCFSLRAIAWVVHRDVAAVSRLLGRQRITKVNDVKSGTGRNRR